MDSVRLSCADSNEPNPHTKAAATISIRITPNRFHGGPTDKATSLSWDHQALIYINEPTSVWGRMPGDAVVSLLAGIKTFAPYDRPRRPGDDIDGCSDADLVRHI
jgi:hypothetical protein